MHDGRGPTDGPCGQITNRHDFFSTCEGWGRTYKLHAIAISIQLLHVRSWKINSWAQKRYNEIMRTRWILISLTQFDQNQRSAWSILSNEHVFKGHFRFWLLIIQKTLNLLDYLPLRNFFVPLTSRALWVYRITKMDRNWFSRVGSRTT